MQEDYYYTVEKNSLAEFKDRGSKFIAYVFPVTSVNEFKKKLAETKRSIRKQPIIALHTGSALMEICSVLLTMVNPPAQPANRFSVSWIVSK